ncbi:MAG: 5/3-nucleotidase [Acidimicrobiaceae bacterium]
MTRTLITNDDGIDSPGIVRLAQAALECGLDVIVAAPSWDSSGSSASLTAVQKDGQFLVEKREIKGLDGVPAFAAEAAPGFIVTAATHGAFGPRSDVVLSGINCGANTGHAVLHSGTVGAALTASTHGCRAMAISMVAARPDHWETGAMVAQEVVPWLLGQPVAVVLNVNVPDVPFERLAGIARARLAPFGAVQINVTDVGKGYMKMEHSEIEAEPEEDTDVALLQRNYATVTPLLAVCEAGGVDVSVLERVGALA